MSRKNLLSVISAVYNPVSSGRSAFLVEMAASVARLEAWIPVEHILKDGGSQDGSLDFYREHCPSATVLSSPDKGIYDAMNIAAEAADGKYLAFLNSDDSYHAPEILAELLAELERSGADYAFAPVRRIRTDGRIEERPAKLYSIFSRMPYCHQTLIVRRDCFRELGGYDADFRIVADHDFALRLYLSGKRHITGNRTFVTFRSGGVSHDKSRNHQERAKVFRKLYGPFYPASDEEFLRIASHKSFPLKLFRELLKRARPEDRFRMIWWYLCR